MNTIDTTLQYVMQNGETIFISPVVLSKNELKEHFWYSEKTCSVKIEKKSIPVVPGKIEIWDDGSDGAPHIHYKCPRCQDIHNVDLYENDQNPRFACCDSCQWDSIVWIEWKR